MSFLGGTAAGLRALGGNKEAMSKLRIAILDDYQYAARKYGDWDSLDRRVVVFHEPLGDADAVVSQLVEFDVGGNAGGERERVDGLEREGRRPVTGARQGKRPGPTVPRWSSESRGTIRIPRAAWSFRVVVADNQKRDGPWDV